MTTAALTFWVRVCYRLTVPVLMLGGGLTVAGYGRVGLRMAFIAVAVALVTAPTNGHLTNFGKKERE